MSAVDVRIPIFVSGKLTDELSGESQESATDWRISCEPPPPPRDDAPVPPPPEGYHARRGKRWLVGCIRLLGGRPLEPATDRCLVGHVLRGKPRLEVPLFSRDDHKRHERNGRNERDQQAEAVDPERKSELEERKGEVDGVPAEAIRSRADDGCRGAVARDGSSSGPEGANCGEEESDRYEREKNADGRPKGRRHKVHRPQGVDREAECDRAKVDERRTHEPEVGDIGLRSSPTVAS